MTRIIAYLKFKDNCRAAMNFYKECFGGELEFQTVKGSVFETTGMNETDTQKIVHSQLVNQHIVLFASEMVVPGEHPNSTFLWIDCDTDEEIRKIHASLARGGKVTGELQQAYWGTTFGAIDDQFGVKWYISKLPIQRTVKTK
ncbi:MAG TPA: VOC family protein [Puia sp.]|jgi:PhnB protein